MSNLIKLPKFDLFKAVTIAWVIYTYFSLMYYVAYFQFFKIEIIQYLTISEVPFLLFNKISFVLIIYITFSISNLFRDYELITNTYPTIKQNFYFVHSSILLFILFHFVFDFSVYTVFFLSMATMASVSAIGLTYIINRKNKVLSHSLEYLYYGVITFASISLLVYFIGLNHARHAILENTNNKAKIITTDNNIISINNTNNLLLPTSNFVFIYNKNDSTCEVIDKSYIRSMIYKSFPR